MASMPRDPTPEATLALLRQPFRFIPERCRRLRSDVFATRVMMRRTVCLTGPDAAALFSDPAHFVRDGAVPTRLLKTLFGQGGVQALDGIAHRHRKMLFMALMTPARIQALCEGFERVWLARAALWHGVDTIELYGQARSILTRAVCAWAGVPLAEDEVEPRARQFSCMFSAAQTIGPLHWRARRMRLQSESWARRVVRDVRAGRLEAPADSPLERFATWRDLDGKPLPTQIAAVELINLLRPTVASAVWVVYVALSLHRYPHTRDALRAEPAYAEWFAQEVRRFYPFFPLIAARVRDTFDWRGYRFDKGTRVLLDLYGIDHDPRVWRDPDTFDPLRFRDRAPGQYEFVPHGPGDPYRHHRCAGERMALELMKTAARLLIDELHYDVPARQDLVIDCSRLPALPRSRFLMQRVRLARGAPAPVEPVRTPAEILDPVNVRRFGTS